MHRIYVTRDKRGLGSPDAYRLIKKAAKAVLYAEGVDRQCVINVLLTDDMAIREINSQYREVDMETDVLSFPQNEFIPGEIDFDGVQTDPETGDVLLGDMVLALPRAREQAAEYGHSEEREIAYLTVHSVLHLLGYDHMDEGPQKKKMREREEYIMGVIGIPRP